VAAPTDQELIDFVIREARLIDMHRLDEWLDLFTEDGIYWMPLEWGQTDPRLTASLMYEDKQPDLFAEAAQPLPSRVAEATDRQA
jgi:3-phenylpropionate/cinnamic acid dioxygenase small subunit